MALAHASETVKILRRHGIRLARSLGQNFLIDENILNKIIETAAISRRDVVLEIGPGIGTLTELLAASAGTVIAVEIDHRFVNIIKNDTLSHAKNLMLVQRDAMKIDYSSLEVKPQPSLIVSNLPYKIAVPIIIKLLSEASEAKRMVFMVQREIADRFLAKPGTKAYGAVTVKTQFYAEVSKIMNVPRNAFLPLPNVDSVVIEITRKPKRREKLQNPEFLFTCIDAAFGQRRKMIKNALAGYFSPWLSESDLLEALDKAEISPKQRGEALDIARFVALAAALDAAVARKT